MTFQWKRGLIASHLKLCDRRIVVKIEKERLFVEIHVCTKILYVCNNLIIFSIRPRNTDLVDCRTVQ